MADVFSKRPALAVVVALLGVPVISANETVSRKPFGKTADGQPVDLYVLTNQNGMQAQVTNYGGIVTTLTAPDRKGQFADVVLGFATLDKYLAGHPYFGAVCGRCGNRIAKG